MASVKYLRHFLWREYFTDAFFIFVREVIIVIHQVPFENFFETIVEEPLVQNTMSVLFRESESKTLFFHCVYTGIIASFFASAYNEGVKNDEDMLNVKALIVGALIHDIGIVELDPAIQNKLENVHEYLSDGERLIWAKHTLIGEEYVRQHLLQEGCDSETLEIICDIVRHHHERLDGTGFPDGLSSTEISIYSQVVGIICSFVLDVEQLMNDGKTMVDALQSALNHLYANSEGYDRFNFDCITELIVYMKELISPFILFSDSKGNNPLLAYNVVGELELDRGDYELGIREFMMCIRGNELVGMHLGQMWRYEDDRFLYLHSVGVGLLSAFCGVAYNNVLREIGDFDHMLDVQTLITGALLHDIGMLSIPQHIIDKLKLKEGILSDVERRHWHQHEEIGVTVAKAAMMTEGDLVDLNPSEQVVLDIIMYHHERADGTGPKKKKDKEVSVYVKIVGLMCSFHLDLMQEINEGHGMVQALKNTLEHLYDSEKGVERFDLSYGGMLVNYLAKLLYPVCEFKTEDGKQLFHR